MLEKREPVRHVDLTYYKLESLQDETCDHCGRRLGTRWFALLPFGKYVHEQCMNQLDLELEEPLNQEEPHGTSPPPHDPPSEQP